MRRRKRGTGSKGRKGYHTPRKGGRKEIRQGNRGQRTMNSFVANRGPIGGGFLEGGGRTHRNPAGAIVHQRRMRKNRGGPKQRSTVAEGKRGRGTKTKRKTLGKHKGPRI